MPAITPPYFRYSIQFSAFGWVLRTEDDWYIFPTRVAAYDRLVKLREEHDLDFFDRKRPVPLDTPSQT